MNWPLCPGTCPMYGSSSGVWPMIPDHVRRDGSGAESSLAAQPDVYRGGRELCERNGQCRGMWLSCPMPQRRQYGPSLVLFTVWAIKVASAFLLAVFLNLLISGTAVIAITAMYALPFRLRPALSRALESTTASASPSTPSAWPRLLI